MAWTIEYTDTANGQLLRLDRDAARRIRNYMNRNVAPLDTPRQRGRALTGPMAGLWRYRVGNYRVVCDIQDRFLRVLVISVGPRDTIYRM